MSKEQKLREVPANTVHTRKSSENRVMHPAGLLFNVDSENSMPARIGYASSGRPAEEPSQSDKPLGESVNFKITQNENHLISTDIDFDQSWSKFRQKMRSKGFDF